MILPNVCPPSRFVLIVGQERQKSIFFSLYPPSDASFQHEIYLQLQTKLHLYSWKYYFLSLVTANVILHLHFFWKYCFLSLLTADVLLNGYPLYYLPTKYLGIELSN
jgi:hypothetical protein